MGINDNKLVIQALAKGLDILECFTSDANEYGIIEISEITGMPESSVQRIINTLEYKGYLVQNPSTKKYRLSLKILTNEDKFPNMRIWKLKSKNHLIDLNKKTGETSNLAIRVENRLIYLDKVDSAHLLRPNFIVGKSYPLYCTAIGRCLLSDCSNDKLRLLFPEELESMTANSKTEFDLIVKELDFIRHNQFAVDDEEFQLGLYCIGSPVTAVDGRVVSAVSLSIPKVRVTKTNEMDLINWTKETADMISQEYRKLFQLEKGGETQ